MNEKKRAAREREELTLPDYSRTTPGKCGDA